MIADPCRTALDWLISLELAQRLVRMDQRFAALSGGRELTIISGHRTCHEQQRLGEQGRPAAPCELSTHVICPATGADLRISGFQGARQLRVLFGQAAIESGLRWGGGSDLEDGIPTDWNHVDLGPRSDPIAEQYRTRRT